MKRAFKRLFLGPWEKRLAIERNITFTNEAEMEDLVVVVRFVLVPKAALDHEHL